MVSAVIKKKLNSFPKLSIESMQISITRNVSKINEINLHLMRYSVVDINSSFYAQQKTPINHVELIINISKETRINGIFCV